jgi:AcrR family transcriptional regulator
MNHLPEGTEPPAGVPAEVFARALAAYEECRRLEMGPLAAELGVSRATLYRWIGSRQQLLGEVLWYRSRQVLAEALRASEGLRGSARVLAIFERYLGAVHARPQLLAMFARDPDGALRLVTSQESPLHRGLVRVVASVLAEEEDRGALQLTIDRATLAYVIVRIGESLIYADRPGRDATPVDHRRPVDVVARLLAGSQVGALPAPVLHETTDALSRTAR